MGDKPAFCNHDNFEGKFKLYTALVRRLNQEFACSADSIGRCFTEAVLIGLNYKSERNDLISLGQQSEQMRGAVDILFV